MIVFIEHMASFQQCDILLVDTKRWYCVCWSRSRSSNRLHLRTTLVTTDLPFDLYDFLWYPD